MSSQTPALLSHDKTRESEAYQRKSSSSTGEIEGEWLLRQPFAGRGMTNVRLSLGEIYNFAVSVQALDPAPGDLVLDLGAGSCWVSDWLNRLLVDTISLDYARDMLEIGRRRLPVGAKQTVGDFERLPLADGSVDGVICLSALHHVPDIPRALSEICRALKPDGRAVFSEPGMGHSQHPQSRAEMAELGVLERDIVVDEVIEACLQAGFRDVTLQPYIFPPPTYDRAAWHSISASTVRNGAVIMLPRPFRLATSALARVVDRFSMLKRVARRFAPNYHQPQDIAVTPSEESTLAWQSLQMVHNAIRIHPVIIAQKETRGPDSRRPNILMAEITVLSFPAEVATGSQFTVKAIVKNIGDTFWLHKPVEIGGFVALGAKLMNEQGLAVVYDYGRGYLSNSVHPGETAKTDITLTAPAAPGSYQLKLDMVDECVVWFEHRGSSPVFLPITVRS